ncbi:MAG: biotin/lipoyl-containing protein, partial [Candidatus Puniceispirillum sp.]
MAIEIKMPALSPTMEVGTLSKWMVAVGDDVRSGDVIAEIETDKATMEVEAVDDGKMAQIAVADGTENVPVGTVIALLAEDGEDVATISSASPEPAASKPAAPEKDAAGKDGSAAEDVAADDATKQEPAADTSKPAPVSPSTS